MPGNGYGSLLSAREECWSSPSPLSRSRPGGGGRSAGSATELNLNSWVGSRGWVVVVVHESVENKLVEGGLCSKYLSIYQSFINKVIHLLLLLIRGKKNLN